MSVRSVILGLLLGLAICVATYFNDAVIHQTKLIGNFFPVSVFGILVVVLLGINPLLGPGRLRGRELAMIAAIGLAACGWPGSGFFRTFNTSVSLPGYLIRNNAAWQAANLMSYVPGGSAELGEGHVSDWIGLARKLTAAGEASTSDDADRPLRVIWEQLPPDVRALLPQAVERGRLDPVERQRLLWSLNQLVLAEDFWQTSVIRESVPAEALTPLLDRWERLRQERDGQVERLAQLRAQGGTTRAQIEPQRTPLEQAREQTEQQRQQFEAERAQLLARRDALRLELDQMELDAGSGASASDDQTAQKQARMTTKGDAIEQVELALDELSRKLRQNRKSLNRLGDQLREVDRPVNKLLDAADLTELKIEQLDGSIEAVGRQVNRAALVALLPDHLAPPPAGEGWLLRGGDADALAVGLMQQGWDGKLKIGPTQLPWESWAPVLKLWVPVALLVALGTVFLALIVHPQWAERELLPYPIARFVEELVQTTPGRRLPDVAYSKLFWLAGVIVLAIHVVNGLAAWELTFIRLPLEYSFWPMRTLFENASQAPQAWAAYFPHIYFAVIGFAFFLRTEVSLSLGLVGVAYMLLGSILYGYGVPIDHNNLKPGNHSLILFGAWMGAALMILYTGRRYYLSVLGSIFGLPRGTDVPGYAVWAARGLATCIFGTIWVLTHSGMDWLLSSIVIAMVLMMFLVLTRISTETGAFFIQPSWLPVGVLVGLMGEQALGPTAYFLVALTSVVLAVDPREALMPYIANALQIGQQAGTPPQRSSGSLIAMVVVAFFAAGLTTMLFQYNLGIDRADDWAATNVPSQAPTSTVNLVAELSARQELTQATELSGLERLGALRPQRGAIGWVVTGLALVLVCAWARLRFAWWPLHPVIFMVFGSVAAMRFAASFFIGWAIKAAVVRLGGSRSYHLVQPLMIGLIAGEIVAVLVWTVAGAVYYWVTGTAPPIYGIFPT